jgi:hypothetical protein
MRIIILYTLVNSQSSSPRHSICSVPARLVSGLDSRGSSVRRPWPRRSWRTPVCSITEHQPQVLSRTYQHNVTSFMGRHALCISDEHNAHFPVARGICEAVACACEQGVGLQLQPSPCSPLVLLLCWPTRSWNGPNPSPFHCVRLFFRGFVSTYEICDDNTARTERQKDTGTLRQQLT